MSSEKTDKKLEDGITKVKSLFGANGGKASTDAASVSNTLVTNTYVDPSTSFVGSVNFSTPARFGGSIEGEINASSDLLIEETGSVIGKVQGKTVVVFGKVEGDIVCEKLVLKSTAVIIGNVTISSISMEEGVAFKGQCIMNANRVSSGVKEAANNLK